MTRELARESRRQCLEEVLPWWLRQAVDREHGGVLSMVSNAGERLGTDKFVWSQARWLWVMSAAAHRLEPRPEYLEAAERTAGFLMRHGRGADGRWHYRLTREGAPVEGPISIYADCFAVYGLSEYYRLTQDPQALAIAQETFARIARRLAAPDFCEIAPYPMEPGQRVYGTHMMLVEVANELSITLGGDAGIDEIAAAAMDRMLDHFRQPDSGLIVEYLSRDYERLPAPQGTLVIPGNALEGMWFLAHFAERTGRRHRLPAIVETLLRHLEFGWDSEYGGLLLNGDLAGGTPYLPHADKKVWWVHIEAIYALARLLPEDERLGPWLRRLHEWTYAHFPLPGGEWQQRLDRTGAPVSEVIALPVKDPFHLPRALMLLSDLESRPAYELPVRVGGEVSVRLSANPSTGYRWEVARLPEGVTLVGDEFEAPPSEIVGAPGEQVLRFRCHSRGEHRLAVAYRRPWESEPGEVREIRVRAYRG